MRHYAILFIFTLGLLANCKQTDPVPTNLSIDSTAINLGNVKSIADVKTGILIFDKTGDGTISWSATSDKSWLKLNRTAGSITKKDTIKFTADASGLDYGDNVATISYTPTIDNVTKNPIKIAVKVNSSIIKVISSSGYIVTKDEVWGGLIQLKGNVTVTSGTTLTFKEGTKISVADKVGISISGSFIVKGTANNPVRFYSENATPTSTSWKGFGFSGDKLEVSYCAVSDAADGFFVYSSSSSLNTKFDHCLFNNCESGIIDFSSNNNVILNYVSMINGRYGYWQWGENKKVTVEGSIFDNNGYTSIYLLSNNTNNPKIATVNINKSNFVNEGFFKHIYISSPYNTNVSADGCFGLLGNYGLTSAKGNSMTIQNSVNSVNKDIGCGFGLIRGGRIATNETMVSRDFSFQRIQNDMSRVHEMNLKGLNK